MDELDRVERRLRLHDVRVLVSVAETGSMSKTAERLGTSQPAVSRAISDLEHALGVPLLDRSSTGVEPTMYGRALMKRGLIVFDELRQGIKDIESIADPHAGLLRIGCTEAIADIFVAKVVDELTRKHPRLAFHIVTYPGPPVFDHLATRNVELVIGRVPRNATEKYMVVEELFQVSQVVAAAEGSRWARRRKIELAELVNEPWTLPPLDGFGTIFLTEAFRGKGLDPPQAVAVAVSRSMRNRLLATGRFLTMVPDFSVASDQYPFLRRLAVELPDNRAAISVVTVKNRSLSPQAILFLERFRSLATKVSAKQK